ncbi:MAG: class I SAM-dependent methyltransferase [Patescibacteria group bacterium]
MIKLVKGNKLIEEKPENFRETLRKYQKTHIDLGTGNGRFVYKNAIANKNSLYIGIDPNEKQLQEYSKKAVRSKVQNVMFVLASLENLPEELENIADTVTINLPWGSLLQAVAKPNETQLNFIKNLLKPRGTLEIIFGYTNEAEPTEFERLNLEHLNKEQILEQIVPEFEKVNFRLKQIDELNKKELSKVESSWGKKLAYGQQRPLFKLIFQS